MRKQLTILVIAFFILISLGVTVNAATLTTQFAQNNGYAGNTFDLVAATPLTIDSFDVNIEKVVEATHTVDVYYRLGTAVGNEGNFSAWTLLGSDTNVIPQGLDNPTPVNVGGLSLTPGQVYGIYISLSSYGDGRLVYTNGGPTIYSDANLKLTTNTGEGDPAFSLKIDSREWNGSIHYTLDSNTIPTLNEWGMILLSLIMLASGIVMMRRRNNA